MIKSGISKKTTTTTASHYVTLELETAVMVLSFKYILMQQVPTLLGSRKQTTLTLCLKCAAQHNLSKLNGYHCNQNSCLNWKCPSVTQFG